MKRTIMILTSCALLALAAAQTGRGEFLARLSGSGVGKSVWKTRDKGPQMQAELSVEGEDLAPSTDYAIVIGPNTWMVTTDEFGDFDFDQRYIGPNRPAIFVGTQVNVVDASNAVVLSGTFARRR